MSEIKFVELSCIRCGGQLKTVNDNTYQCISCGKTFEKQIVTDVADQLRAVLNEQKQEAVANLRRQLWAEMHEENINSEKVRSLARDIKKYLPEDYFANFCEIANSEVENNSKQINAFLNKTSQANIEDYADIVLDFMIKSLRTENITVVAQFIERAYKGRDNDSNYDKYTTWLESEADKIDKGIYDLDLPRDVFLAYSSADMDKVLEICEYLESNDISCFMALRNLRHGRNAIHNYDQALKTAIENCKTVVFVSSTNSRNRKCDAFTKELPYIRQKDLEVAPAKYRHDYEKLPAEYMMPRVEYVIEGYRGNVAEEKVREFFHGLEWCNSKEAVAKRVLDYLTTAPETTEEDQTEEDIPAVEIPVKEDKSAKYCKKCGTKNRLGAKFCSKCKGTEFAETYDEYLAGKIKFCALCGTQCDSEANACDNCGSEMFVPTKKAYEDLIAQMAEEERQQKIREEQERLRREAEERKRIEEERKRKEEAERLRKVREEQERLRREEEERKRKIREEEERKRNEEAERLRKVREEQERLRREEEERKRREEVEKKLKELQTLGDFKIIDNDYITFGTYPQSKKADNVQIGEVYDKERGYYLGSDNCFYGKSEIFGTFYYKVEPIKWKVLSRDSELFIVSDIILDAHVFGTFNENNYANSEIRSWLNSEFYNKAFSDKQKKIIVTTDVDNSLSSTGCGHSPHVCSNTKDKVFLLSRKEAKQYFGRYSAKKCKSTDYAWRQGASKDRDSGNSKWWLRSPYYFDSFFVQFVDYDGSYDSSSTYDRNYGVLPAIKIKIDFDIKEGTLIKYRGNDKKVVIPEGVKIIGSHAFLNCAKITSIKIPKSVNSLDKMAFKGCTQLKELIFEDEKLKASYEGFDIKNGVLVKYNGKSVEVVVPDFVKEIGSLAFLNCSSITSIKIPKSVKSIAEDAFKGCTQLKDVIFEDEKFGKTIKNRELKRKKEEERKRKEEEEFQSKRQEEIERKREIKRREEEERQRYINENFDIQNGVLVKYKGKGGDVKIPKEITSVSLDAFGGDALVSNFEVSSDNKTYKSIDGDLYSYDGKTLRFYAAGKTQTTFTIPKGVVFIGKSAFNNSRSLENIVIPDSVTSIGSGAFNNCTALKSIIIPNGVTFSGSDIFAGCNNLQTIYCRIKKPLFGSTPKGWEKDWLGNCKAEVVWNYKGK